MFIFLSCLQEADKLSEINFYSPPLASALLLNTSGFAGYFIYEI